MSRLLVVLCVALISCTDYYKIDQSSSATYVVHIDNATTESIDLIDIVDSIEFYALESCADCYFNSKIDKMEVHDSLLLVLNSSVSPGIRVFNYRTGRMLSKLESGVKGRDELFWQSVGDFEIVEDKIYIYNYYSKKNYTYSFEGDLLEEFDVNVQLSEFEIDREGRFATFTNFDDECYKVFWIDQRGFIDSLDIYSLIDYCSFYRTEPDDVFFSDMENQFFLIPSYGNTLLIKPFDADSWKTILLEFDKGNYPKEYFDLLKKSGHRSGFELIQEYNNNFDYALPINSFVSMQKGYLFTNYMNTGHFINFLSKDLKSSQTMKLANSINNYLLTPEFTFSNESNSVISIIDGDAFHDAQLKISSSEVEISDAYYVKSNLKEILDRNMTYPNNVLVKYYLTLPFDH